MDEAPLPPLVRVRLTVAYDGSSFHGFAPNPGVLDRGRHASPRRSNGSCATRSTSPAPAAPTRASTPTVRWSTSSTTEGVDLEGLVRALNGLCGPSVAVREPALVPDGFSSRFDAVSPSVPLHDPHRRGARPVLGPHGLARPHPLDLDRSRLACDPLHRHPRLHLVLPPGHPRRTARTMSAVRDVHEARWEVVDDETLRFWIEASSFCHQMVRSIVGTHGRRRARASSGRATSAASSPPATGPPPARWRRPTASACGRSATPDPVLGDRPVGASEREAASQARLIGRPDSVTRPMTAAVCPDAARVATASAAAPASAAPNTQATAGLGVGEERARWRRRGAPASSCGRTWSRLRREPPGTTSSASRARTPSSTGIGVDVERRRRRRTRRAMRPRWPSRPNPVTSVQPVAPAARAAVRRLGVEAGHRRDRGARRGRRGSGRP